MVFTKYISDWFISMDLSPMVTELLTWVTVVLAVGLLALVSNFIARRFLLSAISLVVKRSKTTWDDALLKHKVFSRLSHLAPAMVIYSCAFLFGNWSSIIQRLALAYMAVTGMLVFSAFLNAVSEVYNSFDIANSRPIKGYLQLAKIIVAVLSGVLVIATLMDQSPVVLLSGIGAMTAVLMLIFKDSILGLIASLQISMNNMISIGDWIEVPQFGADGDVIDINLHSVMVQNWDKTITSIPAYSLISGSFKNWRGMSESEGRRIKRSILIDIESVKFCDQAMLHRFRNFQLISDYVSQRQAEVVESNQQKHIETSELINGRNLTNVGTFREYIKAYLGDHPKIHKGMTFLVRQLAPTEHGLPIELYVFSNDQDWINYEEIQADIFDHLLAVLPMFELRIFQRPSNAGLKASVGALAD